MKKIMKDIAWCALSILTSPIHILILGVLGYIITFQSYIVDVQVDILIHKGDKK